MKLVFLFVLYFFLRESHTNRVGCCAVIHVAILSLSIELVVIESAGDMINIEDIRVLNMIK